MGFSQFFQRFQHAAPGRLAVGDGREPHRFGRSARQPAPVIVYKLVHSCFNVLYKRCPHGHTSRPAVCGKWRPHGHGGLFTRVGYFDLGDHSTFGLFCAPEPASTPEQVQILVCGRTHELNFARSGIQGQPLQRVNILHYALAQEVFIVHIQAIHQPSPPWAPKH